MALKTSDVLRKAGDVLRERGWCQNSFVGADGEVCASGALRTAFSGRPGGRLDYGESYELFTEVTGERVIPTWNDEPSRTASEVMHALDAAYVLALQEEGIEPGDVL